MKVEDFNNFSEKLVRKLDKNERAVYRVLNVREDPDNYGKFIMPAALTVPPTDMIWDKFQDKFVPIASIERQDLQGNAVFQDIVFTSASLGYIVLNGSNHSHQKMYQFLELCNYNESNPDRNEEYEALFKRVDAKKEAKKEREIRKKIVEAMNKAYDLDDSMIKNVGMALGIQDDSVEVVRNEVENYIEEDPEEFLRVLERASLSNEAILKEAIKQGVIRNNVQEGQFEWTDTEKVIHKYTKKVGKDYIRELAEVLSKQNPDELVAITTRIK